jgi:hypothetical protein
MAERACPQDCVEQTAHRSVSFQNIQEEFEESSHGLRAADPPSNLN